MTRFRSRRPPPQLVRATTIQKSSHEVAVHWWRYRHYYLEARLAQLAERQHGLSQAAAAGARSAVLLHSVPPDDRAVFARHVDAAIATALAAADPQADPDMVEADALHTLIAEAEGQAPGSDGWGFVPEAGGQHYDVKPLPDADPRATPLPSTRRPVGRRRLALAGVVLLAGTLQTFVLARNLWGAPATDAGAAAASTPPVDTTASAPAPTPLGAVMNEPLDALRPTSLEIVRDDTFVFPIDASAGALGAAWTPELQGGRVAWLQGSIVNVVLCLAPPDHHVLSATTAGYPVLLRIANGETRRYVAERTSVVGRHQREVLDQRHSGVTLIACGAGGNDRTVLRATLQDGVPAVLDDANFGTASPPAAPSTTPVPATGNSRSSS